MRSILHSLHICARKDTEDARSVQVPRVFYLIAEPGYPNYGDELIAGEWLSLLGKYYPETPVVVDCARPGPAAVILRINIRTLSLRIRYADWALRIHFRMTVQSMT